ncbi:hypothetical protein CL614_01040 [archaeon]|nr:hypothetical protein [archaeon]|tara:strand:+ start:2155 stop:3174 length:1020 start_codon:yes stop_codon:yes gene_type:complete
MRIDKRVRKKLKREINKEEVVLFDIKQKHVQAVKKILVFHTPKALNKFLSFLKFPFFRIDYGAIETGHMYKYRKTRVLITAEHAETTRIPVIGLKTKSGQETFIPVGDKNTDKLAKLAAKAVNGAYILSHLPRTTVDMSKSPKELREDISVPVKIAGTKRMMTRLIIHTNPKKERILKKYQNRVKILRPEIIICYHGMHKRHKSDITLGFGPHKIYIGGRKYATMFTKYYKKELKKTLESMKLRNNLKIRRSKYIFLGRTNFTLKKNVRLHNKRFKKKRMGIHVEFNLRGRTTKASTEVPKLRYQVAAQVLAKCAVSFWEKHKDGINASIKEMNSKKSK